MTYELIDTKVRYDEDIIQECIWLLEANGKIGLEEVENVGDGVTILLSTANCRLSFERTGNHMGIFILEELINNEWYKSYSGEFEYFGIIRQKKA